MRVESGSVQLLPGIYNKCNNISYFATPTFNPPSSSHLPVLEPQQQPLPILWSPHNLDVPYQRLELPLALLLAREVEALQPLFLNSKQNYY